jgi:ATP-dependent 26S proteasome regulatory subunit
MAVDVNSLPAGPQELDSFVRLWLREAALSGGALLVECDELDPADGAHAIAARRVMEQVHAALIVSSRERRPDEWRPLVTFEVGPPRSDEQAAIWRESLAEAPCLDGEITALASQFSLGVPAIRALCAQALDPDKSTADLSSRLWAGCRSQARPRMEVLARRIEPSATWDDLVLPQPQLRTLREVAVHVRRRAKVYEQWGFAARYTRGLGISLLAAGPSGTGKTMAAEVLANELRLDLYHIDLSQVVSKYIGETEKNLSRLFDAAEGGAAILLFDEADALFGKRSEVKDSHDRYANIEISYLLQRMEAYRGLAILTTNMKDALDAAFLRRIRFVVQFPFPDAAQRAEIWRRVFPPATPAEGLDVDRLARLNVSGGNIRNIAMNAAFLAAEAGQPVRMPHLAAAARGEFTKLEKPLSEAELGGWA